MSSYISFTAHRMSYLPARSHPTAPTTRGTGYHLYCPRSWRRVSANPVSQLSEWLRAGAGGERDAGCVRLLRVHLRGQHRSVTPPTFSCRTQHTQHAPRKAQQDCGLVWQWATSASHLAPPQLMYHQTVSPSSSQIGVHSGRYIHTATPQGFSILYRGYCTLPHQQLPHQQLPPLPLSAREQTPGGSQRAHTSMSARAISIGVTRLSYGT